MPFITSSLNDQKLQLGQEEFVRPMWFGPAWRKIRIGMLGYLNIDPVAWGSQFTGVLVARHFDFYMGVCQGATGSFFAQNCTEAWLMSPYETGGGQALQRDGANLGTFAASLNPGKLVSRFGSKITTTTAGSTGIFGTIYPQLGQYFVDFTLPGSSGGQITAVYSTSGFGTGQVAISRATFLKNMEIEPIANMVNAAQMGSISTTYNGSFNLDCVNVAWGRSMPTWEITELCVTRFM